MKKQKHFIPPYPPLQSSDLGKNAIPDISSEDLENSTSSIAYQKYVLPIIEREKREKHLKRVNWWKSNLIPLLGLFFTFISALPVIIDFIEYIQSKIM